MHPTRIAVSITALLTAGLTGAGLAAALPAAAAPPAARGVVSPVAARPAPAAPRRPAAARSLARVRRLERRLAAAHTATPRFAASAATTFTVTTPEDSDLATAGATTCVDALSHTCSLRAAVDAANNLGTPVRIVLAKNVYMLSTATALTVTNPGGTSVVGLGAASTTVKGDGSGLFTVSAASSSASPGLLFVSGTTLTGGTASEGGAVFVTSTNGGAGVVLDGDVVTGNTATTEGGGLASTDEGSIYARNTKIIDNVAPEGAGMYAYWSDVRLVDSTLDDNTSPAGSGGTGSGLYAYYGVVSVVGGSISGNSAGDATHVGYGAGIYSSYDTVTLTHVTVDHNTANGGGNGGALYDYYDQVDVTGGELSHDQATGTGGSGGAVYVVYGSQVGLHGVTLADDSVPSGSAEGVGGGAIFDYAYEYGNQLTIDSASTISGADESAVYVYAYEGNADLTIANSTLSGNSDASNNGLGGSGCGGAVCAYAYEYGSVNLSMTADRVTGNTSAGKAAGGAVSVWSDQYAQATSTVSGSSFSGNSTGAGGEGGALMFYNEEDYGPQSVRLSSDTFTGNRAGTTGPSGEGYGGAVAVVDYVVLTERGSTYSKNQAVGDSADGGAIYDGGYQAASFTGTTFSGNSAGTGTSDGYGGAVYTDDYAGDRFTTVTMTGNTAASYGGALYGDDEAYAIGFTGSTVSGNTAGSTGTAGSGGGLYVDDGVLTLENSTVSGNVATGSAAKGGGIWQGGSRLGLRYSTVSGNVGATGAGVYTGGYGGTLLGSIVSGNHAATHGAESDCGSAGAGSVLSSLGGNVVGQAACVAGTQSSDAVTTKPGLAALASNGGPTRTLRLVTGSPAIGRSTYDCPATDQRGRTRPAKVCDAGAYQRAAATVTSVSPSKGRAGQVVTLKGSGFTFARTVRFGRKSVAFTVLSDTRIRTRAPKGLKGKVTVTVSSPDGAARKGKFTYRT